MREAKYEELVEEIAGLNDQIQKYKMVIDILNKENDSLLCDCAVYEEEWHDTEFQLQCAKKELEKLDEQKEDALKEDEVAIEEDVLLDLIEENADYEEEVECLHDDIDDYAYIVKYQSDVIRDKNLIIKLLKDKIDILE